MLRNVPLKKLPAGLEFPADLQHKVSYDAAKELLAFDGFMSKTEFDRLLRLSNELEYQRKLELLFRLCVYTPNAPAANQRTWPSAAIAGIAALAAIAGIVMMLLSYGH